MATQLVPIEQARHLAPALSRERLAAGTALSNRFADNVADAFPRLSIKGKVFRVRVEGQEAIARDPATGHPYAYLDVVLVNASPMLAKTYYTKGFTEGDMNPPDCWSLDSIRPDPSVANKVNPTCLDCPKNAFGSRITPDGKAAKACADSRRVAVVMPHDLLSEEPHVYLMRVPQSSLKNMKNYAVDKLARNGYEPGSCVTRLSFDPTAAFPKLQFEFVGPVTDDEFSSVVQLATSPRVSAMLLAPDFDNVASAINATQTQQAAPQRQAAPLITPGDDTPQQGFAAGMLHEQQTVKTPEQTMFIRPSGVPEETWTLIEETGELLNLLTGEIKAAPPPKQAAQEVDPEVIPVAGGRFYHRGKGKFVASQFKDADVVSAVAQQQAQPEAQQQPPAKRTRTKKAPAADEPQAQQQAAEPPAEEPEQGNGQATEPIVVAASPRLEQLLGGLTPKDK